MIYRASNVLKAFSHLYFAEQSLNLNWKLVQYRSHQKKRHLKNRNFCELLPIYTELPAAELLVVETYLCDTIDVQHALNNVGLFWLTNRDIFHSLIGGFCEPLQLEKITLADSILILLISWMLSCIFLPDPVLCLLLLSPVVLYLFNICLLYTSPSPRD